MSTLLKVYGGTPADRDLCESCQHLREIQGVRNSDCIRRCEKTYRNITFKVARCSYYTEKVNLSAYTSYLRLVVVDGQLKVQCSTPFQIDLSIAEYLEYRRKAESHHSAESTDIESKADPSKVH